MAEHRLHAHELWPEEPAALLSWCVCLTGSRDRSVVGNIGTLEWKFPATKTDTAAHRTTQSRRHACLSRRCLVVAVRRNHGAAQRRGASAGSPLLATCKGHGPQKKEVTALYREVTQQCCLKECSLTGPTGATRMASAGHGAWIILFRTGVVLWSVRDALLGQQGGDFTRVTEAMTGDTLDDAHTRVRSDRGLGVAQWVVPRRADTLSLEHCVPQPQQGA